MVNPGMLKKLKKMQEDMLKAQQEINNATFYGSAAGVVDVSVKGTKEVSNIKINMEITDKEDLEILQDSLVAALNDAFKKVDKETEETMGQFTSASGLGSMGGLF